MGCSQRLRVPARARSVVVSPFIQRVVRPVGRDEGPGWRRGQRPGCARAGRAVAGSLVAILEGITSSPGGCLPRWNGCARSASDRRNARHSDSTIFAARRCDALRRPIPRRRSTPSARCSPPCYADDARPHPLAGQHRSIAHQRSRSECRRGGVGGQALGEPGARTLNPSRSVGPFRCAQGRPRLPSPGPGNQNKPGRPPLPRCSPRPSARAWPGHPQAKKPARESPRPAQSHVRPRREVPASRRPGFPGRA